MEVLDGILSTGEIHNFYRGFNRTKVEDFRKLITSHVSEWSPTVDWRETAVNAVGGLVRAVEHQEFEGLDAQGLVFVRVHQAVDGYLAHQLAAGAEPHHRRLVAYGLHARHRVCCTGTFNATPLLGTVLVSLGVYFGGSDAAAAYATYYFWVVLAACYRSLSLPH